MMSDFHAEFVRIIGSSSELKVAYDSLNEISRKRIEEEFNSLVWTMLDLSLQETDAMLRRYRGDFRQFMRASAVAHSGKRVQFQAPDWVLLDRRTFNEMGGNTDAKFDEDTTI